MTSEPLQGSAGALLRAAREKQGLHIAALAASIKVAPRKLEALEGDRWDELSGATFTRALAQSVCRALRIDAAPVLALLPQAQLAELDHVTGRLNTPFRERASRDEGAVAAIAQRSLIWAGGLLLVAAVATYLVPSAWFRFEREPEPASAVPAAGSGVIATAPAVIAPVAAASTVTMVEPAVSTGAAVPAASSATAAAAAAAIAAAAAASSAVEVTYGAPLAAEALGPPVVAGALQLSASDLSWVEVRDGSGRILLSRNVQRGETIGVDGATPLRLTVGNAAVTQVTFRGKAVVLVPGPRDNVARLELN